ncbi:hypothetical protein DAQ1742_04130 [Dickeya aquatica]|uniref:Type IV pilus biogenesis protein PilO n=1 Tax=Dickeya aquatica TaxID=1401087 RepID=A0A375AFS4_9GAMM|nr:hypothetical protein DAQ1742_04130 [Dickeya aquatica]
MKVAYPVNWLIPFMLRWLAVPLWQLLLLPVMGVLALALVVIGLWSLAERQSLQATEQQYQHHRQAIEQIRDSIAHIPLQAMLRDIPPLTGTENTQPDVAALLARPISQSGVVLANWQPGTLQGAATAPATWQLTLHADYAAILNFLACLNALDVVVRIDQLSLRKGTTGLIAALQLSLPADTEQAQ